MKSKPRQLAWVVSAVLLLLTGLGCGAWWYKHRNAPHTLEDLVAAQVKVDPGTETPCPGAQVGLPPLHLLVLGQSNAANSGESVPPSQRAWVTVWSNGHCYRTQDPLPGGTAREGSVWTRLPEKLKATGARREVLITVLAAGGTSVNDWVRPGSALGAALQQAGQSMAAHRRLPDLVLWQQGEADALVGTSPASYSEGLKQLRALLHRSGVHAPLLLAKSTLCRAPASPLLHAVIDQLQQEPGFAKGADTDRLTGPALRSDGCHFTALGMDLAADLWVEALLPSVRQ